MESFAVRTTTGRFLRIDASPESSISDFKANIVEQLSSPSVKFVKLFFRGLSPHDDSPIGSLGVQRTDFFIAHPLDAPPDVSDEFDQFEIRTYSDEEYDDNGEYDMRSGSDDGEAAEEDGIGEFLPAQQDDLRQLVEMGFSEAAAIRVYAAAGHNVEMAANLLAQRQDEYDED
jgi:hypothetical protein